MINLITAIAVIAWFASGYLAWNSANKNKKECKLVDWMMLPALTIVGPISLLSFFAYGLDKYLKLTFKW